MPSDEKILKCLLLIILLNQRQLTPDDANDTIKWLTEGMKKSKVLDFFSNAILGEKLVDEDNSK